MNQQSEEKEPGEDQIIPSGLRRLRRWSDWWRAFDLRDCWWRLLDLLETRRALRWTLYGLLAAAVSFAALRVWVYPWWTKRNAISMARQWISAGRLDLAADAVRSAVNTAPEQPETWQLAAELARSRGRKAEAVEHARHAAMLGAKDPHYVLEWASAALQADMPEEADRALATLSSEDTIRSAFAQRLRGELARRRVELTAAKFHFEAALQLDGPVAIDEVPLGLILLNAADPAERKRGLDLLGKWTTDQEWGAAALRALLGDALARDERPAMLRWAEALRAHPGCTVGDMPNCLAALSRADERQFEDALATLEKNHAVTPPAAAQLVGWLNQIGRSAEAIKWMKTLPSEGLKHPPLAVVGAEALRQTADWPELRDLTRQGDWGDVDFLRWAYGMQAARALGETTQADEFWRTLRSHAAANSVHALFAGDTIFTWGRAEEAVALWWAAADQGGPNAIQALGTLARHYQVSRNAEGQYRAFRQLHFAHPQDADVSNNFVYFAALTGHDGPLAERLAIEDLERNPQNLTYLATRAFVMFVNGRAADALALLKPKAAEAEKSPALAFAYGLALAGTGNKTEARALLERIPQSTLAAREVDLIKSALGD
jgi:predicted Zn-dependent protease